MTLARLLITRNRRLPAERRDWAEVQKLVEQVEKQAPDAMDTALLRADFFWAKGDPAAARARLEAVRKHDPQRVEPWTSLAILAGRQGKPRRPSAVLDEARRQLGDRVELRFARAEYWARHGGDEARKALAELAKNLEAFSPEDQLRLKDGLANAHARIGDFQEAGRLGSEVAEKRPDDVRIALLLFDLAIREDAEEQASALQRAIARLRRIEGEEGVLWRFGEAARLVHRARQGDRSHLGEARTLLTEAARRRPGWARIPLLEAQIAELERNPDRAIAGYLKAIEGEKAARDDPSRRAVAQPEWPPAEADRLIEGLVEQFPAPVTGTLGKLAAESALRQGDPKRAADARASGGPGRLDGLSRPPLARPGPPDGQGAHGGRRGRVPPRRRAGAAEPDPWLAWIDYLAATDQKPRAQQAIEAARRKLPPDQAPLVLARGSERIGARDQAEQQYRALLAARPDDPAIVQAVAMFYLTSGRPANAQPLFRKILDPKLKATPEDRVAARRGLALSLSSDPNPDARQFLEAMALIDQNLRDEGNQAEDQRLKALLLASRRGRRREAIATYEELARRVAPQRGGEVRARPAPRGQPRDRGGPQPLARPGRRRRREPELPGRAGTGPLDPRRGRGGPALGRPAGAGGPEELRGPSSSRPACSRKRGRVPRRPPCSIVACRASRMTPGPPWICSKGWVRPPTPSVCSARPSPARSIPRRSSPSRAFLGRRGHAREALDLCEGAWKTCPPEAVSNACVVVLDAAKAGDDQRRRVAGWIEEAIGKAPKSVPLLFDLANLQILRGNYPEAETLMRRIIALLPGNSGPLNNLAWLLATRGEKPDEALELINRAIALDGAVPTSLDTRGLVYLAMGRTEAALKDLTEAVAANPSPVLIFHLARAQLQADRRDAARESFHKAKDAGLEENTVDSLEKEAYRNLVATLER